MFCHRVLPVRDERRHVFLHHDPVGRGGEMGAKAHRCGYPEGQAAVLCPDRREPLLSEAHLADASGRGELEGALVGEDRGSGPGTELEVSNRPYPLERTVV